MNIITSLLDTDLYKYTMMNVVYQKHDAMVEYKFKCRDTNVDLSYLCDEVNKEVDALCNLKLRRSEITYLKNTNLFCDEFLGYLKGFSLNRNDISITKNNKELSIVIKGLWHRTILFEVPVLAIVNELYFRNKSLDADIIKNDNRFFINNIKDTDFKFVDFGTRRRHSKCIQEIVVKSFKKFDNFVGTSNVYFAKKYKLNCTGTMAHEYICAHQACTNDLINCQKNALQEWQDVYRGNLGIALSDTLGFDAFLIDFDKYFAKLYDGVRHDSGDPAKWCKRVIKHYEKLGINPKTKIAVFSDGLNFKSAFKLYELFNDKINVSFGIGTRLTNPVENPLQIVIKMVKYNMQPVAKISDSRGKGMCEDKKYLKKLKKVFKIKR